MVETVLQRSVNLIANDTLRVCDSTTLCPWLTPTYRNISVRDMSTVCLAGPMHCSIADVKRQLTLGPMSDEEVTAQSFAASAAAADAE